MSTPKRTRTLIIGALGMDFHTYNMVFREDKNYEVVAFTFASEQNVGTTTQSENRKYPAKLAGHLYPHGIPMYPESKLEDIIIEQKIDEVVFAYSDVSHNDVMHKASRCLAAGANYRLISHKHTQDKANVPVISVCAVRTGCGKSQLSQYIVKHLKKQGFRVVAIREPMPYGDLVKQEVMRFASESDLVQHKCTVEEREEYEAYINQGLVIYSGVDYVKIRQAAEKEADIIVWDGGNNEISFYQSDLLFVVADPLRPGAENCFHPGETNCRSADVFVINKCNSVEKKEVIDQLEESLKKLNPRADVIRTNSVVSFVNADDEMKVKDKSAVVVEDGPTCTHGHMAFGAGYVAAKMYGVKEIVKPAVRGGLVNVFKEFPHLSNIVPAMAYSDQQLKDLEQTLNETKADVIINGSPVDLQRLVKVNKPIISVCYRVESVDLKNDQHDALTQKLTQFTATLKSQKKPATPPAKRPKTELSSDPLEAAKKETNPLKYDPKCRSGSSPAAMAQ